MALTLNGVEQLESEVSGMVHFQTCVTRRDVRFSLVIPSYDIIIIIMLAKSGRTYLLKS